MRCDIFHVLEVRECGESEYKQASWKTERAWSSKVEWCAPIF